MASPHIIMTSSNGNIFRAIGPVCGEFTGEFPSQNPVTQNFGVLIDLHLNKRLSKQSRRRWFETSSRSLWRHCNDYDGACLVWQLQMSACQIRARPRATDWHRYHDDVIKWKHFPRYWPFVRGIHRSQVNFPHKGQWCGALMFSLICAWING